ncbi:MAG: SDR family NAD(P)-dependent oxidoreductase [Candidatus Nanopelagicales bacterium]
MGPPVTRPGPVLVTGANSGIGLATALHLAGRGWPVWGTVRSRAKATVLRNAAREAGVDDLVHATVLDVSDHDAVVRRWPRLPDFYGVVNNAGASHTGAVEEVSAAEAKALLDINLVTPAVIAGCALPSMRARGSGRIVNVSSIAGLVAVLPFQAWYHASKFGLEALSDVLRLEVAPFGVRVSLVEPGFFHTEILGKSEDQLVDREASPSPYAAGYARVERITEYVDRIAPPPGAVARAITSALESGRPKRRYLVGRDTLPIRGIGLLPQEITDRVVSLVADLGGGR